MFQDGRCTYKEKSVSASVLSDLPERSVYLFDPDENESHPLESDVFTIVATSPQVKHYKALRKDGGRRFYVPCWSLEELQGLKLDLAPEELEKRFLLWGGVPRHIVENEILMGDLSQAIEHVDLRMIEKYQGSAEIEEQDQVKLRHMLVQYHIDFPFDKPCIDFASPEIGRRIVESRAKKDYRDLIRHYEEVRLGEWQGPYAGHLWEELCHAILSRGSEDGYCLQRLGEKGGAVDDKWLFKQPLAVTRSSVEKGKYFRPFAKNYPVIDAAIWEGNVVFGLQTTLQESHAPTAAQVVELMRKLLPGGGGGKAKTALHLVWVVDPSKNWRFGAQSFKGLESLKQNEKKLLDGVVQWRLCLRFPQESPFARVQGEGESSNKKQQK